MAGKKSRTNGKKCEDTVRKLYKDKGYRVRRKMKRGADFGVSKGKEKGYVEAKYCQGKLTAAQKALRERAQKEGKFYHVVRCACSSV